MTALLTRQSRTARLSVICLALTCLPSCGSVGAVVEAAGAAASAAGAYYSYKAANRPVITQECSWAQYLEFADPALESMTTAELQSVLAYQRAWERYCGVTD